MKGMDIDECFPQDCFHIMLNLYLNLWTLMMYNKIVKFGLNNEKKITGN